MLKKCFCAFLIAVTAISTVGCSGTSKNSSTSGQENKNNAQVNSSAEGKSIAFPKKPIQIIVPWAVGGIADVTVRQLATVASKYMEQPVAVVNQPGAAATLATTQYLQEKPDGYKLLALSTVVVTFQPHVREVTYAWNDLSPITGLHQTELFLLSNPSKSGLNSLEDIVALSKKRPIAFGSNGPGAADNVYGHAFLDKMGVKYTDVVFDDGISVQNALLGGHIDLGIGNMGNFEEQVKIGNLKVLGTLSKNPVTLKDIGEIPTLREQGVDIAGTLSYFIVGRAGTPDEVIQKLNNAFTQAMKDEEFQKFVKNYGLQMNAMNPEELNKYIKDEIKVADEYFGGAKSK